MKSPPRPPLPAELEGLPAANRFGKFACIRRIGSGGMGEVWQAWDTELRRWVALKLVLGTDQELLARFRREALLAAQFTHPHAAAIYEFGESRGRPYIAMQFVDGETLKVRRPAEPRDWVPLLVDAARAVHAAHDRGIIHRDLKPDNFMVDGDYLFVMDFGLARPVDANSELSQAGTVVGTPSYMSPEQARALEIGPPADVWGLGATMYDLLAGRPPFRGGTVFETVRQVLADDPAPLSADPDLSAIVMKCLEKAPRDRYGSALELAEDLERWMRHEPIRARKHSPGYRLRKWIQKHRTLALAAGAASILLLVVGALLWRHAGQNRDLVIRQLRETAETSLAAALELRRSGNLEGMEKFAARLEEACARASAMIPDDPEPWCLLARLHRARMEEGPAAAALEEALKRQPRHGPSRYERVILTSNRLLRRTVQLIESARSGHDAGSTGDPAASVPKLIEEDPQAAALKRSLDEDLAAVLADLDSLASAEVECARGMAALAQKRMDTARSHLTEALRRNRDLVEAVEALGAIGMLERRWDELAVLMDEALERDRGYRPFLEGRVQARLLSSHWRLSRGGDPTEELRTALHDVGRLLDLFPRSAPGYLLRARIRIMLAAWESSRGRDPAEIENAALEDFARILEMAPDAVESRRYRGNLYMTQAQREERAGRSPEPLMAKAIQDYQDSLARQPDNAATLTDLGVAYMSRGNWKCGRDLDGIPDFTEAVRTLSEAISRNRAMTVALQMRAGTRINWANQLAPRQPRDALDLLRLAIDDLDAAHRLEPGNAHVLMTRGNAHGTLARHSTPPAISRFELALRDLDEAAKLAPRLDEVPYVRALMLANWAYVLSDPEPKYLEALDSLKTALEINPARHGAHGVRAGLLYQLAFLRRRQGRDGSKELEAGLAAAAAAVRGSPTDREAWIARSKLLLEQAILEKLRGSHRPDLLKASVDAAREATRVAPGFPSTWNVLAYVWMEVGVQAQSRREDGRTALREACAAYAEAVRLGPGDISARVGLAKSHLLLGVLSGERGEDPALPYEEAILEIDRVLERDPNLEEALEISAIARLRFAQWRLTHDRPDEQLARAACAATAKFKDGRSVYLKPPAMWMDANIVLAKILDREGRPEEQPFRDALAAIERICAEDPSARQRLAVHAEYCRRGLEKLGKR